MEIKESSIEWLMVKIHTTDWVNNTRQQKLEIFEQAKEMHKQEIMDAYKFGISDEYVIGSEEYYNKTFGK